MKECDISQKQIEEAIYYFDTFNDPLHCLQFLCRQQMWSKATDYAARKVCCLIIEISVDPMELECFQRDFY